jgi:hypothetical protein
VNEISAKLLNAELQLTQMKNTAEQLRGRADEAAALNQKIIDIRQGSCRNVCWGRVIVE